MFEVRRERRVGDAVDHEVAYGITSLSREKADAARLLAHNRGHWGIENGLHHRRDVTMREDASRIRKGSAPELMAALRNLILFVLNRTGRKQLPTAIRHFMCHPQKALELVSTPI